MEWLIFGAGWVTGWLLLGLLAVVVVVWGLCAASAQDVPAPSEELDAHERLTWQSERQNGHRTNVRVVGPAREARPWQF